MIFLGQHHIINRLTTFLPDLYKGNIRGSGLLFAGPSGYGKTTLAISCAKYLCKGHAWNSFLGSDKKFVFDKHVNLIDEVHLMKNVEILYPVLDAGETILLLTTNFSGDLPEALVNRCRVFDFSDYSMDELVLMAMEGASFKTTIGNYEKLVIAAKKNPRELKILVDDFGSYFRQHPEINTLEVDFEPILSNVFLISNGLDTKCRRYLEVLSDVGGKSSLHLLCTILHLDANVVTQQIEPILLQKGLIQISSKGRILI